MACLTATEGRKNQCKQAVPCLLEGSGLPQVYLQRAREGPDGAGCRRAVIGSQLKGDDLLGIHFKCCGDFLNGLFKKRMGFKVVLRM